ncbi:chemotaxis protein CheC [Candidatus Woesearchaeota archaeon]|nr:chemotaxis protein CheC [Candidatus Woesearchaeota archaeon]
MDDLNYSSKQLDVLNEMASIGSGNAATALSKLLGKRVVISPISSRLTPIEKIPEEMGGADTLVMSVYLGISGDLSGDAVFLNPKEQAMQLIDYLTNCNKEKRTEPCELDLSAYKEMSNIFTGSYMNAISTMLKVKIIPSVPHYASDMIGSLIDFILSDIGQSVDSALLIKTDINIDYQDIGGGYIILFDLESLQKMLRLSEEYNG